MKTWLGFSFVSFLLSALVLAAPLNAYAAIDPDDASPPIRLQADGIAPLPVATTGGARSEADSAPYRYVLGRGDQISVTDYGGMDLRHAFNSQTVTILPDGTASIYPVGVVAAAGKTLQELTDLVNERAKQFMIEPKLLVALARPRAVVVYVLGDVLNPGIYTLGNNQQQSNSTTGQGPELEIGGASARGPMNAINLPEGGSAPQIALPETTTLLSALQKAGGLKDSANVRSIRITRARSKEIIFADLWKLLVTGDVSQDVELEPRDVVFVRRGGSGFYPDEMGRLAATQSYPIRIWGAVKQPGLYQLGPNDDALSAIAKAGGFTQTAFKNSVLLSRVQRDGTVIKKHISISKALRDQGIGREPIRPGDVIIATENPALQAARPAAIALMTVAGAILVLYVAARIKNINVQTGTNTSNPTANTNVRVAIPSL